MSQQSADKITTLQDIGERRITQDVLPKYCQPAGDDCAFVTLGEHDIVLTTDPVPEPAAKLIGGDPDLYWTGRLVVTINASDLAAAGAKPLAFVSAIECSPSLPLSDLERLLEGVRDGCNSEGLAYVGGNMKEASRFAVTGTAIGTVRKGDGLHRSGAKPGDLLYSLGYGGAFWRDALRIRAGLSIDKSSSPLFAPSSQVRQMQALLDHVRPSVSMDNSDGLLATLSQLAAANNMLVSLNLEALTVEDTTDLAIDPCRLWLGWGDWNVIIAIPPDKESALLRFRETLDAQVVEIGVFSAGPPIVRVTRQGRSATAPRLESERFARDSWFTSGIEGYIRLLESVPLL